MPLCSDTTASMRPAGVTIIAIAFFIAGTYLAALGIVRLVSPELLPLSLGAPLLHGLEISGPYMFLIAAAAALGIGWGLLRLRNIARRVAIFVALAGVVMLVPQLSADAAELSPRLLYAGSAVMIRVAIVWYLWQSWTAESFH